MVEKEMKCFKKFVHDRKNERRRNDETLPQRPYFEAQEMITNLMDEINSFDTTSKGHYAGFQLTLAVEHETLRPLAILSILVHQMILKYLTK